MRDTIRIKPHHFIDLITAIGAGKIVFKPHPFGHADYIVIHKLTKNPNRPLQIELDIDDICYPCRFHDQGQCHGTIERSFRPQAPVSKQSWNRIIDLRWCERLKLQNKSVLSASAFCERIQSLAKDITDIYAEIPPERTQERAKKLLAGVNAFLHYTRSLNAKSSGKD